MPIVWLIIAALGVVALKSSGSANAATGLGTYTAANWQLGDPPAAPVGTITVLQDDWTAYQAGGWTTAQGLFVVNPVNGQQTQPLAQLLKYRAGAGPVQAQPGGGTITFHGNPATDNYQLLRRLGAPFVFEAALSFYAWQSKYTGPVSGNASANFGLAPKLVAPPDLGAAALNIVAAVAPSWAALTGMQRLAFLAANVQAHGRPGVYGWPDLSGPHGQKS